MKFEMFDIDRYDRWGDLVKKWANDAASRPKGIEDFKTQVKDAGIIALYPYPYSDVEFIAASSADPILRIKLPPKEVLQQAEKGLEDGVYPLPKFYTDQMYDCNLKVDDTPTRRLFHSMRVGEYTIKFCG
ncbi:MAG TPA: hypothetical protein VN838_09500 [Bradyrhizobium sp.]|nr:hypothetical protein [Bradyrhizobium sp.]